MRLCTSRIWIASSLFSFVALAACGGAVDANSQPCPEVSDAAAGDAGASDSAAPTTDGGSSLVDGNGGVVDGAIDAGGDAAPPSDAALLDTPAVAMIIKDYDSLKGWVPFQKGQVNTLRLTFDILEVGTYTIAFSIKDGAQWSPDPAPLDIAVPGVPSDGSGLRSDQNPAWLVPNLAQSNAVLVRIERNSDPNQSVTYTIPINVM